jgi:hypothetical protein
MGARPGDEMANHHLIPEQVLKDPRFANMFSRLRGMGFNGDKASNGIFLPGNKDMAKILELPGHWTQHPLYTADIESQIIALNRMAPNLSDMQLILGIREIQTTAAEGLMNGKYIVDLITGVLK